jgi:methylated-DNA-[protein]-cysteine S-methyltransferase
MVKAILRSPVGPIVIDSDDFCVESLRILAQGELPPAVPQDPLPGSLAAETARQIAAWFDKRLDRFDLPLKPAATARGEALRAAIVAIPAGETLSYGALARIAQSGARAIGQACARNPYPILVPCHRVVGSGGAIGHYSGGNGIITKRWLLDHEKRGGLL